MAKTSVAQRENSALTDPIISREPHGLYALVVLTGATSPAPEFGVVFGVTACRPSQVASLEDSRKIGGPDDRSFPPPSRDS